MFHPREKLPIKFTVASWYFIALLMHDLLTIAKFLVESPHVVHLFVRLFISLSDVLS